VPDEVWEQTELESLVLADAEELRDEKRVPVRMQ
jgi:hypothetical protein